MPLLEDVDGAEVRRVEFEKPRECSDAGGAAAEDGNAGDGREAVEGGRRDWCGWGGHGLWMRGLGKWRGGGEVGICGVRSRGVEGWGRVTLKYSGRRKGYPEL